MQESFVETFVARFTYTMPICIVFLQSSQSFLQSLSLLWEQVAFMYVKNPIHVCEFLSSTPEDSSSSKCLLLMCFGCQMVGDVLFPSQRSPSDGLIKASSAGMSSLLRVEQGINSIEQQWHHQSCKSVACKWSFLANKKSLPLQGKWVGID